MITEAKTFDLLWRYLNDLSINPNFANLIPFIYPRLEIKETTSSFPFLHSYLKFDTNSQLSTSLFDKRDDFNFVIINFPQLDSIILTAPAYVGHISQPIRCSRDWSLYSNFFQRDLCISIKLFKSRIFKSIVSPYLSKVFQHPVFRHLRTNVN